MTKEESAIKILKIAERQAIEYNEPVEIAYSGGKDSDVLLQLAKDSGIKYRAIYKNTTIDPKGTLRHCIEQGVEIVQPQLTFKQIIEKKGFPSRWFRFCCSMLKEYKILNSCALGVRQEESTKRKKKYKTFEYCRILKGQKVHQYAPLYDWTLTDIEKYIIKKNIKLASFYYKNGNVDLTKRLGCVGCPLKSDNGLSDFKNNLKILVLWLKAGQKYLDTHTHSASYKLYGGNVYNMFFAHLFCKHTSEYKEKKQKDLFGNILDCERELKNFFNL